MRSLTRLSTTQEAGGQPLPITLRALRDLQVSIRGGEVTMVAGIPGAGKSSLALHIAQRTQKPTLYICADTSGLTMKIRLVAMLTGRTQQDVEQIMQTPTGEAWANKTLEASRHIVWTFDSAPSLDDIDREVRAFEEVYGIDPALIIIDNLIDVAADGLSGDEWGTLRAAVKELKFLARDTGAAVVVLHHTQEGIKYDVAPPRSTLQGKVAQLPALILTVHSDPSRGLMAIAAVKNRFGAADPTGNSARWVYFDGARMSIEDIEH